MDPKSFDGKPLELPVTKPEFGAWLAEWVKKDNERALRKKREREERKKKKPAPSR
jgi:hypothetical protein